MTETGRTTLPTATSAGDPDSPVGHDVVVAGGGASGLATAVFTARYGLDTAVFDGGKAAITQCAHVENYLGFPGGLSPQRFLDLGRAQAVRDGATVRDERATTVRPHEAGFVVETVDGEHLAERVVVAAAYDGDVLAPVAEAFDRAATDADKDDADNDEDPFVPTDAGRTAVDGLYVDWVVHEGRYGGDGWDDHVDEWFDREMLPDGHDLDQETIDAAREDLKGEFLGRQIDADERDRREQESQRMLLDHIDNDLIRERANELEEMETTHAN